MYALTLLERKSKVVKYKSKSDRITCKNKSKITTCYKKGNKGTYKI